ncbi:MAG: mannitol dehydrogenase family protein, partial [Actinomycetota bacterium]|nr:mannitol dehydrogenase family protein [Actinomycetota bacterium]
ALVPCDNLPGNGEIARRVVVDLAELLDAALAEWIEGSVRVVTTVVDRITPRVGPASGLEGRAGRGRDESPVVTEPFSEWVLSGEFPAGRPSWEDGGALFVEDVAEFERRKLWLVNGAHSLLAYAGSVLGLRTVAEAMADDRCVRWVEQWWATACPHLSQPAHELASYTDALVKRLANVRMNDELSRIAEDGSQKLPLRILPVLRAEREAGRIPYAATRVIAAWTCHLRGSGVPVRDVRAAELAGLVDRPLDEAAREVLVALDPESGSDPALVATVAEQCRELVARSSERATSRGRPT